MLGCYYLTLEEEGVQGEGHVFMDPEEAITAYSLGHLHLHARIFVKASGFKGRDFAHRKDFLLTTVGKIIFNEVFPPDFPYINNADLAAHLLESSFIPIKGFDPQQVLKEVPRNKPLKKDLLADLVARCYRRYGNTRTAEILDKIKKIGFHYATRAGITVGIVDIVVPPEKQEILKHAEEKWSVESRMPRPDHGEGRYNQVMVWSNARR